MALSDHFTSAKEMLGWAVDGIQELKVLCDAFLKGADLREAHEPDLAINHTILKVTLHSPLPQSIPRKASEALLNIRHAFDRSIYAACMAIGKPPKDSVYFPWADGPEDLEYKLGAKAKPNRKIKERLPSALWDVLRRLEPYGELKGQSGGNAIIRALAKIANRKHTLRLNFGAEVAGIDYPDFSGQLIGPSEFVIYTPRWDMSKNEIIIAKLPSGMSTSSKYNLGMYVAFNESPPLRGVSIVDALNLFAAKAHTALGELIEEANRITQHGAPLLEPIIPSGSPASEYRS